MATVQLVAAQHAGVDVVVYHSFNKIGTGKRGKEKAFLMGF